MILYMKVITVVTSLLITVSSSLDYNITSTKGSTCWTQTLRLCKSSTTAEKQLENKIFNPVSPWMFRNETSGACECSDIPYRAVLCDPTIPRTSILDCYCMTHNSEQNETELGRCLYGCGHKQDILYYKLPQNESLLNRYTCSKAKRDSTLCGACQPGYSPLVYSYDMSCMNCTGMTYNWIKYIAVAYIPLTFFYFLVVICRFSGTSPLVKSFINICQGIVSPMSLRAFMTVASRKQFTELSLRILGTWYGIWNLDFFRTVLLLYV